MAPIVGGRVHTRRVCGRAHAEDGDVVAKSPAPAYGFGRSQFIGHASITQTLDRYGHLFPGSESEAASALDAYLEQAEPGIQR